MARVRPHRHHLDIYDADLWLATNASQWRALARMIGDVIEDDPPDLAGQATFATFHPDDGGMVTPTSVLWIAVAAHKTPAELVNTCAHEAAHAAGHLLGHIGQEYGDANEAHAYLVGWLTQWMWERCQ